MATEDRQSMRLRVNAGKDRRYGSVGGQSYGGVVPEPGRGLGERCEVRVANRVDLTLPIEERFDRELVEDDDHHRCLGTRLAERRMGAAWEDELRDRRREYKQRDEEQRR